MEPPDDEAAALGKVRELLFGEQAREVDNRLKALDKRVSDAIWRMHQELSERMETLGRDLYAKLDQLANHVATIEASMQENGEQVTERLEVVREEVADRVKKDTSVLDARITENRNKAIAEIARAAGDLDAKKMDREALAVLLSEIAARVSNK